jgi:DNA-directed RNA polymerase specialized sigma24 family protein
LALCPEKNGILALLDSDPVRAQREYDRLRFKLIRYFAWNRARCPDDFADETFFRVWRRVSQGAEIHSANPDSYFYGVAANILKEERGLPAELPIPETTTDRRLSSCGGLDRLESKLRLEELLRDLPPKDRTLLLRYYTEDPQPLAREHGITLELLRLWIHRIKRELIAQASEKRAGSAAGS